MNVEKIIAIHYLKQDGEYIVTTRNECTGKRSKNFANRLTAKEKEFTQQAKHKFEDSISKYWTI